MVLELILKIHEDIKEAMIEHPYVYATYLISIGYGIRVIVEKRRIKQKEKQRKQINTMEQETIKKAE